VVVLESDGTSTNVVVRVARCVVEIDVEHTRVGIVVPVASNNRQHIRNLPLIQILTNRQVICRPHLFFQMQRDDDADIYV